MNSTKKIIGLLFVFLFLSNTSAIAQEGYISEIRVYAGTYPPRGWAFCEGQTLAISSNQALFSLIGCQYGGDCRTTFKLPDLRGRVAMGAGTGPGLTTRVQGSLIGWEDVTLNSLNLPSHTHTATVTGGSTGNNNILLSKDNAVRETPQAGDVPAVALFGPGLSATKVRSYGPATNTVNGQSIPGVSTPTVTIGNSGSNSAVDIVQPSAVVRYIICMQGTFPPRD